MTISLMRFGALIRRLLRNDAGNTLIITGFLLFPMIGMIGSGIDMSRAYMVKTRLQAACDSGVLAGRRAMSDGDYSPAAEAKAKTMFNFNFPAVDLAVDDVVFTTAAGTDGEVTGTATGTLPTLVMHMFNFNNFDLAVDCSAELQIANADIMFVLDITGSMACAAADSSSTCSSYVGANTGSVGYPIEKTDSRVKGLRAAVIPFNSEISSAASGDSIIRYDFVPYSSGINVANIGLPSNYFRDSTPYQSRAAKFSNTLVYEGTPATVASIETYPSAITSSNCVRYGNNQSFTGFAPSPSGTPVDSGTPPANTTSTSYSAKDWGCSTNISGSGTKTCRRNKSVTTTTGYIGKYKWTNWVYRQDTFDTSSFKSGGTANVVTGASTASYLTSAPGPDPINIQTLAAMSGTSGLTSSSFNWDGCIEERDTVVQSTFSSIPSNAYDLQIDVIPSSSATRWRTAWNALVFDRSGTTESSTATNWQPTRNNSFYTCPKAASKLVTRTATEIADYVSGANGFKPTGGTYHDFGLIWGARMLSPTGLFSADNAVAANGRPISRNIIFMTDGDMAPNTGIYGLYGREEHDQRITGATPSNADLKTRHNSRFTALCTAIKGKDITLWVVAYG